jgi:signal transduction histidine kinase
MDERRSTERGAWRKDLLLTLIRWSTVFGGVIAIGVTIRALFFGFADVRHPAFIAMLAGYSVIAALRFLPRLSYRVQAVTLSGACLVTAASAVFLRGLSAAPVLLLGLNVLISGLFLGRGGMLATLVLVGAVVGVAGRPEPSDTFGAWSSAVDVVCVAGVLTVLVQFVVRRLEGSIEQSAQALERVRAEQALRERAQEELMRTQATLQQTQKLDAIGRLAGGVAHDFNNILTAITGHTSLLLGALAPDTPLRADAEAIKQAADRAAGLTNQLLAFSRKQVRAPRVLELPQVVRTLDPLLRRLIGEHISLTTRTVGPPAHVRADPSQLDQVVLNLAINARDAMPNGGAVLIETALVDLDAARGRYLGGLVPGRYGLLTVSDNGPGMDEETRARIFEPFFTTKAMGQGTGLGLSTVYGIVQQSGGYVRVSSAPGAGASFLVYLPHVDAPVDQPAPLPSATVPPRGHETVLLAEDEDAVRRLVSKTLRAQGYRVLDAPDGPAALALAAAHSGPVDLLLTDVVMPGMSGRELAERLSLARPGTRVLFMSGYAADTMDRHGVTEGGQSFLPKPFTLDELARKLRDVLDHN